MCSAIWCSLLNCNNNNYYYDDDDDDTSILANKKPRPVFHLLLVHQLVAFKHQIDAWNPARKVKLTYQLVTFQTITIQTKRLWFYGRWLVSARQLLLESSIGMGMTVLQSDGELAIADAVAVAVVPTAHLLFVCSCFGHLDEFVCLVKCLFLRQN